MEDFENDDVDKRRPNFGLEAVICGVVMTLAIFGSFSYETKYIREIGKEYSPSGNAEVKRQFKCTDCHEKDFIPNYSFEF